MQAHAKQRAAADPQTSSGALHVYHDKCSLVQTAMRTQNKELLLNCRRLEEHCMLGMPSAHWCEQLMCIVLIEKVSCGSKGL